MKKKLLITGVSGLLGSNLAHYFKDRYHVYGLYRSHRVDFERIQTLPCDLTSESQTKQVLSDIDPDIVIHCASLTNVDQCEMEQEHTRDVNVKATCYVRESISDQTALIYISSDSVYEGKEGSATEDEQINPQNCYGRTKLEGELEVLKHSNSLVLRTNIFGWNVLDKKSLGEWLLDELQGQRPINGFMDASFSTIYTFELAKIIDMVIQKEIKGVYNCGSSNNCTKYQFALSLAEKFGFSTKLVNPISVDEYPFRAKRGKNLSLKSNKIEKVLKIKMPTIEHSIECFYRDYHSRLPHYLKKEFTRVITKNGKIPYGRQWIDGSDIEAVSEVLRSDWITQGPKITEFERALCDYTGAKYGTAVNSGTSALHICCLAAGIKPGDEVITSPITFVASANCVRYCGGTPIFADIDLKTYNIDPKELEKRITEKTKAVIPVHFAGQSCDLSVIRQVVKAAENRFGHKIWIIEDASHALGSRYKGHEVGSCVYSDMTVLSFHPVKHITTGEGGAVFTNQAELDERLKLFRSHGITSHPDKMQQNLGTWYYEQQELGFNYRITDIQAVLGSSQIKKLKRFKERRREIVDRYNEKFKCLANVTIPYENESCNSNFHLYVLLFDFEKMGINKNEFMSSLRERSVFTQVHYIPVHTQPYYRDLYAYKWGDFPNAEQYFQRCLSFPLFPALHDKEIETVIQAVTFLSQRRI